MCFWVELNGEKIAWIWNQCIYDEMGLPMSADSEKSDFHLTDAQFFPVNSTWTGVEHLMGFTFSLYLLCLLCLQIPICWWSTQRNLIFFSLVKHSKYCLQRIQKKWEKSAMHFCHFPPTWDDFNRPFHGSHFFVLIKCWHNHFCIVCIHLVMVVEKNQESRN